MHLSGSNHEVFRRIVLQDKPHTFHIVFGISPVAACIQIAQIQFVLESLCNAGGSQRNLAGNEGFAAALAFVVEENAVYGEHSVAFAVVLCNPETVLFGYAVGAARVERGSLLLRHFLYLAEQFRGRCLIYLGFLFQTENAYSFEHAQRTYSICFGGIFGYIERDLYVALCSKVVYLVRLHLLDNAYQRAAVRHISIMQVDSSLLLHVAHPLIEIQVLDASGIERR